MTAIAAVGVGFGAGSLRPRITGLEAETGPTSEPMAVTLLANSNWETSERTNDLLAPLPFSTFEEAAERLAALLEAHDRLGAITFSPPLEREKLLDEIGEILSLASEAELVAFLASYEPEVKRHPVLEIAYTRLAGFSPSRAAAHWMRESVEGSDAGLLPIIREWEDRDPAEVELWIQSLEIDDLRNAALQRLLLERAETDPEGTLSRLHEVNPEQGFEVAAAAGKSLDLAKLQGIADSLFAKLDEENDSVPLPLAGFLSAWISREPAVMMEWLLSQDTDRMGPIALTGALSEFGREDPAGFFNLVSTELADHPSLGRVAGMAWWDWLAKDGGETAAMKWLGEHGELASGFEESYMGELYVGGYYRLQGYDWHPERTGRILAALSEIPDSPFIDSFSLGFLSTLSESDPKSVLDFAMTHLPAGSESDAVIAAAADRWAERGDPEEVIRWTLSHLKDESTQKRAIQSTMGSWAWRNPREAAEFAMDLPESAQETAMKAVGDYWPDTDPEGLLSFLGSAPKGSAVAALTESAFSSFGWKKGTSRFVPLAMEIPNESLRHDAMRGLFDSWTKLNVVESAEAIRGLPEGPLRDSAITGFNRSATSRRPELAFEMAARISVAAARDRELISQGREWLKKNPTAAESAIRNSPVVPGNVKVEIFKESSR